MHKSLRIFITVLLTHFAIAASGAPATAIGIPKTSQHTSFNPEEFEKLAVLVKPYENRGSMGLFENNPQQSKLERMVEQGFIRVLMTAGYTLVSRADLDAVIVEKGLDQSNMTDEKLTAEAGKILHVSAIMVVSIDIFKTTTMTQAGKAVNRDPFNFDFGGGGKSSQEYYQVTAAISARLVKVADNMVVWTGDLTAARNIGNQDQNSVILSVVAETVAGAVPHVSPDKTTVPQAR